MYRYLKTSHQFRCCAGLIALVLSAVQVGQATEQSTPTLLGKIQLHGMPDSKVPVITAVAIQPNGDLVATAGDDHIVRLWNIQTGKLLRQLRGHKDWVTAVAFSRDGKKLLSGCRDRQVVIWDALSGKPIGKLGEHKHPITSIVVSETTDTVAIAGFHAPLKIYNLKTGKRLTSVKCPCTDVRAIAFSPNMKFLAAGGRTGKIRLWNLTTSKSQDIDAHSRRVTSIVFTDDEQLLSAGEDKAIQLWSTANGDLLRSYINESGKVLAVRLLDDSKFVAATADNVIRLFELNETLPLAVLKGHTGSIAALDYRNEMLISGSFDTTVRVWSVEESQTRAETATLPTTIGTSVVSPVVSPVEAPLGNRTIPTSKQE